MFCTNCGNQIDDDAIYCNFCGNKIEIEDEEKEKKIEFTIFKDIDVQKVRLWCVILLAVGAIASIINIISFYMVEDSNYILGQMIFGLVFIVSTFLFWKSKKIGVVILIPFISFKVISSIYYYLNYRGYSIKNLIGDEIFYFILIAMIIISWRTLK